MTPAETSFSRFILTEPEEISGSTLTSTNIAMLHNYRTDAAEQKLALKLDPSKIQEFVQNEAYLAGKIEFITTLLEADKAAQQYHVIQTQQNQNSGE